MLNIINGNLLLAKEQYIAHQCNIKSVGSAGLAKTLFNKYPYSNVYLNRILRNNMPDKPGTISIHGDGADQRYIINMFSQFFPGMPAVRGTTYFKIDSDTKRKSYFHQCLLAISKIDGLKSVAFPHSISCGLAGGNWEEYSKILDNFTKAMAKRNINVVLYRI